MHLAQRLMFSLISPNLLQWRFIDMAHHIKDLQFRV